MPWCVCRVHFSLAWQYKLPHTPGLFNLSCSQCTSHGVVILHAFVISLSQMSETLSETDCSVYKSPPTQAIIPLPQTQAGSSCLFRVTEILQGCLKVERQQWERAPLLISNQQGQLWRQSPQRHRGRLRPLPVILSGIGDSYPERKTVTEGGMQFQLQCEPK